MISIVIQLSSLVVPLGILVTAGVERPTAVDPTEGSGTPSELLLEDCIRVLDGGLYCGLIGQDETIANGLWRVNKYTDINDMEDQLLWAS